MLRIIFIIAFLFFYAPAFSQVINIPENDTIVSYDLILKKTGDTLKQTFYYFYKKDTSVIAKSFTLQNNTDTIGVYKEYYDTGKLYKKQVYNLEGLKHGIYQEFNRDGKLIVSGQYKKGYKTGTWLYIKAGRHEVYKKGVKHGRWRIYEGKVPWSLYVYKKGELVKVKKNELPLTN